MKQAVFVRTLEGWRGEARLYKMIPPLTCNGDFTETHDFVIVSAVNAMFTGPETYLFPANEDGTAKCFVELDGSFRGALDHDQALSLAGYQAVFLPAEKTGGAA